MKRLMFVVVIAAAIGGFLAGYWPQHQRVVTLESEAATLRNRVAELDARNRAGALLGELLNLQDAVTRSDFGQAQQLSSTFFDEVRSLAGSTVPPFQAELSTILSGRDGVTSALARTDDKVADQLEQIELQLRQLLGYPTRPRQSD
jgi:hypothetical protein